MSHAHPTPVEPMLVGRYPTPGGRFEGQEMLPVSHREVGALAWFWQDMLETLALDQGVQVLLCTTMDQAAQFYAFEQAAANLTLVVSSAEQTFFDASRVESILRRFRPSAIFGVSAAMLDGLAALHHDPAAVFTGCTAWAWPGAYERLAAIPALDVRRMAEIGPMLAVQCAIGDGLHFDDREWSVEAIEGELTVTSRLARSLSFTALPTGIHGVIDETPCRCGTPHARLHIA